MFRKAKLWNKSCILYSESIDLFPPVVSSNSSLLSLSNCGYVVDVHVLCAWLISLTNVSRLVNVAFMFDLALQCNTT